MLQSCELFASFTYPSPCFNCRVVSLSNLLLFNTLKLGNISSMKLYISSSTTLDSENILALMLKKNWESFWFLKCIIPIQFIEFVIFNFRKNSTPLCKCTWFLESFIVYLLACRFYFVLSVENFVWYTLPHLKRVTGM